MGIKGQFFEPSGIAQKAIDYRGKVVMSPARLHAGRPLKPLTGSLAFILPHILYDQGLHIDPVREYAHAGRRDIPVIYWDLDYPLITGLKTDKVRRYANRIYGVLKEDLPGILHAATAVVAINPQLGRSVRLDHARMHIVDPYLPKTGSLSLQDVTMEVLVWTIQWADRLVTLSPANLLHGMATRLRVDSSPLVNQGLNEIAKVILDGSREQTEKLTQALDTTVLDNNTSGTDHSSKG